MSGGDEGRSFDCDPGKRRFVLAQRRIDLMDMAAVFDDVRRLDFPDLRRDYGEARRITIGTAFARSFTVVYTVRRDLIWLITAWTSSRRERALYCGR